MLIQPCPGNAGYLTTAEARREAVPIGPVEQASAFQAGFAALTTDGTVWTYGDERFPHCRAWGESDDSYVVHPFPFVAPV
jgi:hypothetical protein